MVIIYNGPHIDHFQELYEIYSIIWLGKDI